MILAVGEVCMDRCAPDDYVDASAAHAAEETAEFIECVARLEL